LIIREIPMLLLSFLQHLSSHPIFCRIWIVPSLVFCVIFCRSLFVLLSFFFWPLYCQSFFDWQLLITPFGIFSCIWVPYLCKSGYITLIAVYSFFNTFKAVHFLIVNTSDEFKSMLMIFSVIFCSTTAMYCVWMV